MLEWLRHTIDWGTVVTAVGTLFGFLPTIAVILPIAWWAIKLYKELRDWKKDDSDPDKL